MSEQIYAAAETITTYFTNSGFVKAVGDATNQVANAVQKFLDDHKGNITAAGLVSAIKVIITGGNPASIAPEIISVVGFEALKKWFDSALAPLFEPAV